MKKLVTIISLILILIGINIFYASHAIKLVDDEYLKAGIFSDMLENKKVLAVSPCKLFKSTAINDDDMHILLKKDLKEIFEKSNIEIATVKNKNGKLCNEETAIGTGSVATSKDEEKYTIVLYGDANGDGRICNTMDIEVIRQDYVFNNKAEEEYKLAADLQADGTLNVRDVQQMVKKYIGELDETVVNPFPEDEEIAIVNPEITVEITTNEDEATIKTVVTNLEEVEEYSKIKNYRYNLQRFNGITYEDVLNGNIETEEAEYTYTDLDDGEYILTAVAVTENGVESALIEKQFTIVTGQAELEITDYSKTSITVNASIEGKEIASVKHFYEIAPEYNHNTAWKEVEGSTTAEFTYTNDLLTNNIPYYFKAEVTTVDGKVYETNTVNWMMGYVGTPPSLVIETTTDEDEVTINVEVTNLTEVERYSKIKSYSYRLTTKNGDTYEEIENGSVTTEESQYTFKGLEEGNYRVFVVAETEKGATSSLVTRSFTIKKTVAKLEIVDYTKGSVTVEATIEGKEIASVKHFYMIPYGYDDNDYWHEAKGTEAVYTYTNEELADNTPYNLKAEITTTDGKVFETNMPQWLMGNVGDAPDFTVTATTDEDTATIKTELKNDVVVSEYQYILLKQNGNSYAQVGEIIKIADTEYTFEGLEDGNYKVTVIAGTEKGAYTTKFVSFTINTLDEGETLDEAGAIARVESTGKMYITVQYAVNAAANTDTVTMLKDSTEAVTIPKEKNITLAMGNQTLTGVVNEEGTSYAVKVLGDLTVKSLESGSTITLPYLGVEENTSTIILEGDANLTLETITNEDGTTTALDIGNQNTNTSEMIDSNNIKEHAVILNNGTGDININGLVTVSGHTNNRGYYGAITDNGNGSNITITKGRVSSSTIGIVKTGSGTITIGENVNEITGLGVLQVYAEKTPLLVNPNVTVNFYQGNLVTTTTDPEIGRTDPDYVDGYMHGVCLDEIKTTEEGSADVVHEFDAINDNENVLLVGGADKTSASYRELTVGETKNESEAVAKVESTGIMYTTIQYAIRRASTSGDTVTILKDINTSEKVEANKNITINLNGKTVNSYFEITKNVTISDNTSTPGTIDLSNDTINPAISVIENGSLTLNNGVNIKAHTIGVECTGENAVVNIIKANIEETYLSEYEEDYSAVKIVDGGSLYIKNGDSPAEVNLTSDRYAIYANNATTIEINNNQEQDDDGYLYEIYGDISSIYAYNNTETATEIKIAGGRFITYASMDRTVISTNGKINLETTGGIIGNLEVGKGIAGNPVQVSASEYYIPNFKINGTTKVFAFYYGIYIGGSRYNIPTTPINLEIGTDDNGESEDGVQIEANTIGVYLATSGGVNAIIGAQDLSYNGDNSDITTNGGSPIIKGYNTANTGIGMQSAYDKENSHLIINCRAIVLGNSKCLDGFGNVYTSNNEAYTIIKGDENDEGILATSPVYIRATYLKNK